MKDSLNTHEMPLINLFGEDEECFYQLGLKDAKIANFANEKLRSLLSTSWKPVNIAVHKILENLFDRILYKDSKYKSLIDAYCEGCGLSPIEYSHTLLVPEICSMVGFWMPHLSTINFGCSSIFCLDEANNPIHARILDFPLKDMYDKHERIIRTSFPNNHSTISYTTAGLPFSGLTSMNSEGLTLAIHQKFSDKFYQEGTPIFYLSHKLIQTCSTCEEALEFLKNSQTITCWNFNIMDKEGNILEADLSGDELIYHQHNLKEEGSFYICNELVDHNLKQQDYLPFGIENYNNLRIPNGEKIAKKVHKKSKKAILKEFSTPKKSKKFQLSPVTLSTMACVLFSPKDAKTLYIPGEAPKISLDKMIELSNIWDKNLKTKVHKLRSSEYSLNMYDGMKYLAKAQNNFDSNNFHDCYHNLQMAIETFDDENWKHISEFYFIVVQYIHETHSIVLKQIHTKLVEVFPHLPTYLQDISKILDIRISKLTQSTEVLEHEFENENLLHRAEKEILMNALAHKTLRHLTFIHIDVIDVIFA